MMYICSVNMPSGLQCLYPLLTYTPTCSHSKGAFTYKNQKHCPFWHVMNVAWVWKGTQATVPVFNNLLVLSVQEFSSMHICLAGIATPPHLLLASFSAYSDATSWHHDYRALWPYQDAFVRLLPRLTPIHALLICSLQGK